MAENSKIEWTDHTFNPWWGCVKVSPGCEHCYAETFSKRTGHDIWGPAKTTKRRKLSEANWKKPERWNDAAKASGERARVFCASMADVFEPHPDVQEERDRLFDLIVSTPWLDWQLLTKRPELVGEMAPESWMDGFPRNVWMGTSVEDQKRADERIPHLLRIPARVRFLSCEPLLGPVRLNQIARAGAHETFYDNALTGFRAHKQGGWTVPDRIRWVIVGGESGPGARPMEVGWAESLVAQCRQAGVPVFVKQLGARPVLESGQQLYPIAIRDAKGGNWNEPAWSEVLRVREMPGACPEPATDTEGEG